MLSNGFLKIIIIIVTLGIPATSRAEEKLPICTRCPAGTKEIALLLYAKELNEFPHTGWPLTWFKPPGNMKKVYYEMSSWDGVPAVINEIAAGCARIGYLAIATHGDLGTIAVGQDIVGPEDFKYRFSGLDCVMADNARINFLACNLGRGCRGETFLMTVAQTLLRRGGGSVKANTSLEVALGGMDLGALNADHQILYVEPGLEHFSWDNQPQSVKACRNRAIQALKFLPTLKKAAMMCNYSTVNETIKDIQHYLNEAIAMSNYETVWAQPDNTHFAMGNSFYYGFDSYFRMMSDVRSCIAPQVLKDAFMENPLFQVPNIIERSMSNPRETPRAQSVQ